MTDPQRRRWLRRGIVAALVVLAVLAFDSNWLKGPIERGVSARLDRAFTIGGEFDIEPRLPLRFVMTDVRLANPPWAQEPDTLRIERVAFSLALVPLLRGRVVLPEVDLQRPVVDLERSADGANNFAFGKAEPPPPGEPPPPPPVIGRLTVDEGLFLFHDPANETALVVEVVTTEGDGPNLQFSARGTYQGAPSEATGTGGSMLAIADTTAPYPLRGTFRIGKTQAMLDGTITGLAALAAADLRLDLSGESLSDLYPLLGLSLPPTPPYRITGRLIREGVYWRLHDFTGTVGDSDLAGDVDVAYEEGRARVHAALTSKLIDLDDLAGFIGAKPQAGPGETASPRQAREKAEAKASPRLLPDLPLRLVRLRAMDADVRFRGASIRGRTPLDDLEAHLVLKDGVLTFQPLNFGVAGGNVVSTLVLDGRDARAGVDGDFEFRRIDLRRLFPDNAAVAKSSGLLGGHARLVGNGNSLADVLATADGAIGLAMSGGQVSNLVLELAGLDFAEALSLLFRGDKPVALRCAVADLTVKDGLVEARSMIVDTTDTNVNVTGRVNLGTEELDLTLHPLPKDYSPVSLRSPVHVRGSFKKPRVRLDEKLIYRGGIAAILGAVAAPLVALVGLVETGPGDDAQCEELIAAVEKHAGNVPEANAP